MKLHKYYSGFYKHYEILDDDHTECVIKDTLSNKYYQKSYKFVQKKFSGVSLKEVKWNIKDTLIFTIIVLSVPILIIMLNQAFSFSFNGTIISGLILILNVIIHEFGHSTALLLFGKKVANYKFKFKWIFPSIVCDTSEAYMLPNYEKIIVFYSGVLFNIISCMILWRLNYLQECMPTLGFIIFNLIPIPFLETDGYNILYYGILRKYKYRNLSKSKWYKLFYVLSIVIFIFYIFYDFWIKKN